MTAKRFVLCFVAAGVLLPVLWFAFYWIVGRGHPDVNNWLMTVRVDNLLLMFWPSSILMIADPEDKSIVLPIISTALNAALYGILGTLVWVGLRRSKIVLIGTVALVLIGWYGLLRL
ncbi:MAG: hypothetical protein ABI619_10975 [Betaproteobacteria bacterium]